MKRLVGFLTCIVAAVVLATFIGDNASAQEQIYVESSTSDTANDIVNGRIISVTSVELDDEVFRVSEVEITSSVKGSLTGTVFVETPGGERSDGTIVYVSHTPKLDAGALVQLALAPRNDLAGAQLGSAMGTGDSPVYSVVNGSEGAYSLLSDGMAAAVGDYSLTGVQFSGFNPAVGYRVNPANSGLSSAETIAAVHQGFDMWENDASSSIDFVYEGTSSKAGWDLKDGQNTVSWVSSSENWLAQATWQYTSTGEIVSFDVRINRSRLWSNGATTGRFDIGTVVGHEVGHAIGLHHVAAASELMYDEIRSGVTKGLGSGDSSGARALYPYIGPSCNGEAVTVNLETGQGAVTEGRDVILGTAEDDWIWSGGGDDLICGGLGVDRIFAGQGNDVVFGGGGSDRIYGQGGHDEIHGGSGADRIWGGSGSDTIFGNGGQDRIWGEEGNDTIQGNWESDHIWGGPGNDVLRGAGGKDKLYGEDGNDSLFGGLNTDYLNGGAGSDTGNGQRGVDKPLIAGVSGCEQLAITSSC